MTIVATHSVETIAKLLDLSTRRVQQLVKDGVIPKTEKGRYELAPCVRGYIAYLRDRNIGAGIVSLDEARMRKTVAEAQLSELQLEKERGSVLDVEQIEKLWSGIVSATRQRILSIPAKLAPIVAVEEKPATCKAIIEEQIIEALHEITEQLGNQAKSASSSVVEFDNTKDKSTTKAKGKSVGGSKKKAIT